MVRLLLFVTTLVVFGITSAFAQQRIETVRSPILVVDTELLYLNSAFGQRIARDQEAKAKVLSAENARIEKELADEEQRLTEMRATVAPDDFRELADIFDEKVQLTRARQLSKSKALSQILDQQRVVFFQAAGPVLQNLMREAGAAVVMERRDIFLSADAIDITNIAILRIDAVLGEGSPQEPTQD